MKGDLRCAGHAIGGGEDWQLRLRGTETRRVRRRCFGVEPWRFDRLGAAWDFHLGRWPLFILRGLTNAGPDVIAVWPHRTARVRSRRQRDLRGAERHHRRGAPRQQRADADRQLRVEVAHAGGTSVQVFRQRAMNRRCHRLRDRNPVRLDRRRLNAHVQGCPFDRIIGVERQLAGEQLVGDDAERVDVALRVDVLHRELLRAHVRRRTEHDAERRQLGIATAGALGDAEIEHLDEVRCSSGRGDDDVVRLEIAMDDAAVVRLLEGAADLTQDQIHSLRKQRAVLQDLSERLAAQKLHGDEQIPVVGLPEVEELDGVGVLELSDRAALALEPLRVLIARRDIGEQDLDRDLAADSAQDLLGQIDPAHTALGDQAVDLVATPNGLPEQQILAKHEQGCSTRWAVLDVAEVEEILAGGAAHQCLEIG